MPELPEVETTRRGIEPHVLGKTITQVLVRNPHLRWRVTPKLINELPGKKILSATRRGKYILLGTSTGTIILHLGMSGSLRVVNAHRLAELHDHVDIVLDSGDCLRLHDPRRFGALLWTNTDALQHKLLKHLGPEPLTTDFSGEYLFRRSRGRSRAVRDFLLDSQVVAGVGNIYANESLFTAGIRPTRAAGSISRAAYLLLAQAIQDTLNRAIQAGGTTLRDFHNASGKPGYFQLSLHVYGRATEPCIACGSNIRVKRLGQRSVFFCPKCQL